MKVTSRIDITCVFRFQFCLSVLCSTQKWIIIFYLKYLHLNGVQSGHIFKDTPGSAHFFLDLDNNSLSDSFYKCTDCSCLISSLYVCYFFYLECGCVCVCVFFLSYLCLKKYFQLFKGQPKDHLL